jgi:hypothetical protein
LWHIAESRLSLTTTGIFAARVYALVQNEEGLPIFQPLQSAFNTGETDHLIYFAFDFPVLRFA